MNTYSASEVERLLRSYGDIRSSLEGSGQRLPDNVVIPKPRTLEDSPLGMTPSGQPWPFMEKQRAKTPIDGKKRARQIEDLHVFCIDLELAFPRLAKDDQELLRDYHILQTKTLEEIAKDRGVSSKGSMRERIWRSVKRLAREMERNYVT